MVLTFDKIEMYALWGGETYRGGRQNFLWGDLSRDKSYIGETFGYSFWWEENHTPISFNFFFSIKENPGPYYTHTSYKKVLEKDGFSRSWIYSCSFNFLNKKTSLFHSIWKNASSSIWKIFLCVTGKISYLLKPL